MDFESFDAFIERIKQQQTDVGRPEGYRCLKERRALEQAAEQVIQNAQSSLLEAKINQALDERNKENFFYYAHALNTMKKDFIPDKD